jgi:hypothetical protein
VTWRERNHETIQKRFEKKLAITHNQDIVSKGNYSACRRLDVFRLLALVLEGVVGESASLLRGYSA